MGSTSPAQPPPDAGDVCLPPKKRKRPNDSEEPIQNHNCISALPNDILIKILTLMPIREAAITSLSTQWRHLWKNVNHLMLDANSFGMQVHEISNYNENPDLLDGGAKKFIDKVNGLLHSHGGNGIKKFTLEFPLTSAHASELDRWIRFAAAAHTKSLSLFLCFSSLCDLFLVFVTLTDEVIQSVMSICVALRKLSLTRCYQLTHVRTSHGQLQKLDIYFCMGLASVSIHAEKLQRFSYVGHKVDINYGCTPLLCKLAVILTKQNGCPLDCIGAFPKLCYLTLQFPSYIEKSLALQHSGRFLGLKEIVLCLLTSWGERISSVAFLLQAAPLVEKLLLNVNGSIQSPSNMEINWPENFTLPRLSSISITGFSGEVELLELLYFLLKTSPMLSSLLLDTNSYECLGFGTWKMERCNDYATCDYARVIAVTNVVPKVPSAVKFSII